MDITIRANETGEDLTITTNRIDMANEHKYGFTVEAKYIVADLLEKWGSSCDWWDAYDENDNWITSSEI
jgi:hypothetical protein